MHLVYKLCANGQEKTTTKDFDMLKEYAQKLTPQSL